MSHEWLPWTKGVGVGLSLESLPEFSFPTKGFRTPAFTKATQLQPNN